MAIEQPGSLVAQQVGGFKARVGLGDRELHALVGADGAAEDDPFGGIPGGSLDEPAAVADGLGGDQDALGVPAIDDVAEAHPLSADQVAAGPFEVLDYQLPGVVVYPGLHPP